jgi:hypothetical protein
VQLKNFKTLRARVCVHAGMRATWYVNANALSYVVAGIVFLHMKIFVCLIKQACLLAIFSKFGGWG